MWRLMVTSGEVGRKGEGGREGESAMVDTYIVHTCPTWGSSRTSEHTCTCTYSKVISICIIIAYTQ